MPFPPFPENEMNNQAAQTMPASEEWALRAMAKNYGDGPHRWDRLDREVCERAADEIKELHERVAALSQTAGVPVDLEQFRKPVQFWMAHAKTMMPGMSTTATHEGPRLLSLIDAQAAAPAASGVHPDALPDGTLSKSTAKRVNAQRLAQGDGCGACGDACADRGSCQVADDSPPTQPPHQDRGEVEAVAKVIYEQWEHEPGYVKWTDGGNSFKQDHARTLARAALTEAKQQGRTEPEVCPQCFWVNPKQQGPGGAGRSTSYSREALEIQGARWRAFCRTLDHVAPGWDSGLHGAVEVASAAVRELSAYAARMALDGAAAPQVEAKRQAGEGE